MKKFEITQKKAALYLRILYPVWMVLGIFSLMYVPETLVFLDDPKNTYESISNNQLLFRAGIVGSLVTQLFFIFAVLLLYKLFEKVNKSCSLFMVISALVAVPIAMLSSVFRIGALYLVNDSVYAADAMMLFLNLDIQGTLIASIFWGIWLFPLGYLIYKSGWFPRIIGVAVIIGGFGYLLGTFTELLFPELELVYSIFEYLAFGEIVFIAWIVLMGTKLKNT